MPPPSRDSARRARPAAAAGTSAARARPAACLRGCARAARRCRGSAACDRRPCGRARFSRLRSCAGDSSLSKMTMSIARLVARGGQHRRPCRCRGTSPDPAWAAPAARADDVGAGGLGEAGELVERMFGIEAAGRTGEESDECRTLPGLVRARSGRRGAHYSRILARGPRRRRRRDAARRASTTSTMVDGAPPGAGPRRARDRRARRASRRRRRASGRLGPDGSRSSR